jgi:hypothetical protein
MVTIAWKPLGFHLLDALPKATHLIPSTIMFLFSQNFFRSARRLMGGDTFFMLKTQDRTPPENAELLQRKSAPPRHTSPYSPDLALSDFFLFGQIKCCLQGFAFPWREELLATIHEVVGLIA